MTCEIIYVQYGTRNLNLLEQSMRIIRGYDKDISIRLYYDFKTGIGAFQKFVHPPFLVKAIPYHDIKYDTRTANRNNDFIKLIALKDSQADTVAYLDGDVFIVDWEAFCDGFKIARRWGLALPLNPRSFVERELEIAADISDYDRVVLRDAPKHMTAYNMGLIFYAKGINASANGLLSDMIEEQNNNPSRGPMAVARAMFKNAYNVPYALPLNWLVCKENQNISHPICLHVGHKNIMRWWEQEFKK